MKDYSCKTCDFRVMISNKLCCDRRFFENNEYYIVEPAKEDLRCPCHSKYIREETRYGYPNRYEGDSADRCPRCTRYVPNDEWVEINGSEEETENVCSICYSKFYKSGKEK